MFWGDTWLDSLMGSGVPAAAELESVMRVAIDAGVRMCDTAEGYGFGSSEARLAHASNAAGTSGRAVLATKFMPTLWRWTRGAFMASLRNSAQRMGTPCIPLYYVHTPVHPMFLSFVQWACEARAAGLVREVGLSNCDADQVVAAVAVAQRCGQTLAVNQVLFSLLDWNSPGLQRMLRVCRQRNISIVAYGVLGQGLLTDGLTRERYPQIRAARMLGGLSYDALLPLRACIASVAKAHGKTMAQVCLRWAQQRGALALVGVRSVAQLTDALGSLGWTLSDAEMQQLDALALTVSTLDKPHWKRLLFVLFISLLLLAYMLTRSIRARRH